MAGYVWEIFGYRAGDRSEIAVTAARNRACPILHDRCVKTLNDGTIAGVCSIKPMRDKAVICCPIRLYADDYQVLRDVADIAFPPGLDLIPGQNASALASLRGEKVIAVFGKNWGGELRVPKKDGFGGYYVDWVLALIDESGQLVEFVAVEVQTIDTTGNYRASREALLGKERIAEKSTVGFNWENVNKRILPQLIYKGQLLQREELCKKGLFFVCPRQVYLELVKRVGGEEYLPKYPLQPASISLMPYDHDISDEYADGEMVSLVGGPSRATTVYKLQEAFNNVTLTNENVYRDAILSAMGAI